MIYFALNMYQYRYISLKWATWLNQYRWIVRYLFIFERSYRTFRYVQNWCVRNMYRNRRLSTAIDQRLQAAVTGVQQLTECAERTRGWRGRDHGRSMFVCLCLDAVSLFSGESLIVSYFRICPWSLRGQHTCTTSNTPTGWTRDCLSSKQLGGAGLFRTSFYTG